MKKEKQKRSLETFWDVLGLIETLVDVHGVINHVGISQQIDLPLEDLIVIVDGALLEKLQEWENQMTIEVGSDPGSQVVARHSSLSRVSEAATVPWVLRF